jgi:hypothetical protein
LPEERGGAAEEVATGSGTNPGSSAPAPAPFHLGEVKFSFNSVKKERKKKKKNFLDPFGSSARDLTFFIGVIYIYLFTARRPKGFTIFFYWFTLKKNKKKLHTKPAEA